MGQTVSGRLNSAMLGLIQLSDGSLISFSGDTVNSAIRALMKSHDISPIAPTQLGIEVGAIQARTRLLSARLSQKQDALQALCSACAVGAIEALEAAMSTVITAATQLNSSDLNKDADLDRMSSLLLNCSNNFLEAKGVTESYLRLISDLHAQVVEMHATQMNSINDQVVTTRALFEPDLQRTTRQFRDARAAAKVQEDAAVALMESMSALEARQRDAEANSRKWNIIFGILSFGITAAANVDVLGFRAQAASAHQAYEQARDSYAMANDVHIIKNFQMRQVREQRLYLAALQGDVSKLDEKVQNLLQDSAVLQTKFARVQEWSSALAVQVQNVVYTAQNTRDLSVVRQDFVNGFFTICEQVLIDPRLLDEVQSVTDIIDNNPNKSTTSASARTRINQITASLQGQRSIADVESSQFLGPLGLPVTDRAKTRLEQTTGVSPSRFVDNLPVGKLGIPHVRRRQAATSADEWRLSAWMQSPDSGIQQVDLVGSARSLR